MPKKTHPAIAACNAFTTNCTHAIRDVVRSTKAVDVRRPTSLVAQYVAALHNRGATLQSRASAMIMTRAPVVLVQSSTPGHVATKCTLNGYAACTAAHDLVEAYVIVKILARLESSAPHGGVAGGKMSLTQLVAIERSARNHMPRLGTYADVFKFCKDRHYAPNVQMFVAATQSGAVLHTGFCDAGATFRDRTARGEAGRHFAEAVDAIVTEPMPNQTTPMAVS